METGLNMKTKLSKHIKFLISIVAVVLIAIIVLVVVFCKMKIESTAKYIAHRGHGYYDNTEEAFYNSTEFWGVECDVRITSDDKFILNHDETARFDNGETLNVENTAYDVLISKTIGDGYSLCSLSRYLEICKELDLVSIIELKSLFSSEDVTRLLEEIDTYYDIDKCVIISFSSENLLKIKEQSSVELHYLIGENKGSAIDFCIRNKINPSVSYKILNKNDVDKVHKNDLKVGTWTVNDSFNNNLMKAYNVDYITSDLYNK